MTGELCANISTAPTFVTPLPFTHTAVRKALSPLRRRTHPPCIYRTPSMVTSTVSTLSSIPEESEDVETVHPSWQVYSMPGNKCVLCRGEGSVKCLYCYGEGLVLIGPEQERDALDCPQCKGSGTEVCARCEGSGERPTTRYDVETQSTVRNLTNEEVCNGMTPDDLKPSVGEDGKVGKVVWTL